MGELLSGIWAKVAIGAAIALAILLACLKLIGIGRKAEQGEAATKGMERTQQANQARAHAEQPVSKEVENADPNNRDAR